MNDEIRLSAREIFADALELKNPAQRERYLAQACGQDAKLRQMVESLLAAHQEAGEFMQPTKVVRPEDIIGEGPGTVIGRYKLLQQIGEGGFGLVFMAEQLEPVQRKVALKIIKAGMDTREVITRFEAERQALALMDHPNIARVLDAGATESGRPYFVMELVKGIKITDYCDQNNLSTDGRLDLFIKVCHAVQHAHQKGIIHRDLKPTNVMVTLHDGEAVPKVIDFGIAKATGQRLTDKTLFTRYEQMIGTPAYMSPEQAAMSGLDIDTRTDIYALGVLLYELLTGVTPFAKDTLARVAFDEIRRMIQEKEPPKPSTRLTQLAGKQKAESGKQKWKEVRGDLDWIVMKALEKDRRRRYETANDFAEDIERHLKHEPVVASPPSRLYRFRKLVKRNKLVFAAASVVVAALTVGFGLSAWMFFRERAAKQEQARLRQLAEVHYQTAREVVDGMLTRLATDLAGRPRMAQLRRRLLEDALKFHLGFLEQKGNDPELQYAVAQTYMRVGRIYLALGQNDKSLAPWAEALKLLEALARQHPSEAQYRVEMSRAHGALAVAYMWLERVDECIAHSRRQVALCEELQRELPTVPEHLRRVSGAHGELSHKWGHFDEMSETLLEIQRSQKVYTEYRTRFPDAADEPEMVAWFGHWLGAALVGVGRFEDAEQNLRKAHEFRAEQVARSPDSLEARGALAHINGYLGDVLAVTGRPDEALQLFKEAVVLVEKIASDDPDRADCHRAGHEYGALGDLLLSIHRVQEAETALRRSVEWYTRLVDSVPEDPVYRSRLGWRFFKLGLLFHKTGRSEKATEAFGEAFGLSERAIRESPQSLVCNWQTGLMLATCPLVQFRDPNRAVALAKEATRIAPGGSICAYALGVAQYRAGDPAAAADVLQKFSALSGYRTPKVWLYLAMAHWQKGDQQQAREWYRKAVAWIEKYHPADIECSELHKEAASLLDVTLAPIPSR